ncbi:PIR Superfamily Protein [Plasmodium ovale wallikeri]|uniref:PIR Superfamily Protein n=1 Tax=Plasmodium ovale wallikeri TaxID=864142 RepID=A0A1A9A5P7_PLAOA|nr:PIR Superfamily Protein [Plasmodium ovale wallikeri]SBT54058.1 PIR Superfamily Protein [Plasmodium ovale wallikeri]
MGVDEFYERKLPAIEYSNILKNKDNLATYYGMNLLIPVKNSEDLYLQEIGAMLIKNYSHLNYVTFNIENRCSDLNCWLDEQKEEYNRKNSASHGKTWELIEELWNEVGTMKIHTNKCTREKNNKSLEERKKVKQLEHFCENRNYLKQLCLTTNQGNFEKNTHCENLFHYIKKNYDAFVIQNDCIPGDISNPDNKYHISENCSLYYISNTFPQYSFNGNKISENENTRIPIKTCVPLSTPLENFKTEVTVPEVEKVTDDSFNFKILLYIGLVLSGFFFTFFSLYKFTSFGKRIRTLMLKEDTTVRNAYGERISNLLEDTSEHAFDTVQEKDYYLSYESVKS